MILLLFIPILLATFDSNMSPKETKRTGMDKLSIKEKMALGDWIEKYYTKNKAAQSKQKPPILLENLKNGTQIRLSDNSLWEINPEDTPITQSWITPVEITVVPKENGNYTLTNTVTQSVVRARNLVK
jgi:hypothetical protein